jgi:single-strand DNA-binding protein
MFNKNHVELIGHLGRDPEVRSFPDGGRLANIRVATTVRWKDKQSGEQRSATEWHNVVVKGGLVGVVEDYVRKGAYVLVEGHLRTRKYQDKDGADKYVTEIHADTIGMLDRAPSDDAQQPSGGSTAEFDDDIPF